MYICIQLVATQQKITQPKANKNQKYVYIILWFIFVKYSLVFTKNL